MKKYTVYHQNKETYTLWGWQGCMRRLENGDLDEVTKKYDAYAEWSIYKVKETKLGNS